MNQRYGMVDSRYVYMFPTVFDKALEDGGFNTFRIQKDWAENGLLLTETRNGENKRRFKVRKFDRVAGKQTYFNAVKLLDE